MTEPLGLTRGSVVVAAYDARWPGLFQAEAARLVATGAPLDRLHIEHSGSTAVPGLAAKPIIDILAAYPDGDDPYEYILGLVRAGYLHRGEQGIPGRHFFRRGDPRMYHVHLTVFGGTFWRDHMTFRDILRGDDTIRDAYAVVKTELAARYPSDRESYIDGKGPFVAATLAAARRPASGGLGNDSQRSV